MGNVRDGKVLRDTDSWGKKENNKCEGTCQTRSPLPVKKDVIRNHICNKFAHQCWYTPFNETIFFFLLCSSLFTIDAQISHYVFWSSFTSVDLITNFFHGHGGNQHIPKSVCDVDLRFLPPFPGTALIQYVVLCSDTSDIMNPMYAHIYTYTYLF
jgi:hypothetical protein